MTKAQQGAIKIYEAWAQEGSRSRVSRGLAPLYREAVRAIHGEALTGDAIMHECGKLLDGNLDALTDHDIGVIHGVVDALTEARR